MNLNLYLKTIRQSGLRAFTLEKLMADLQLSKNAALNAVARAKKANDLISPAKGFYVIVPPEHQPYGSIPAEELVPLLMQHLQLDYYVGLLSAAAFWGATHQKPRYFQIVTNKRIKHPLSFGQVQLEIIYKKQLANLPIKTIVTPTGYLRLAQPELTTFDLFHYPVRCGGLNHIATVLSELIPVLSAVTTQHQTSQSIHPTPSTDTRNHPLIELAQQTGEITWLQRLGFIWEQLMQDNHRQEKVLQQLQDYLHQNLLKFVPLAPHLPHRKSKRDNRWGIIHNVAIESDQ